MAYSLGSSWSGCFSAAPFFVRPTTAHFIAADRQTTGHNRYKAPIFDPASGDAHAAPHKVAQAQEEQNQLKQQQQRQQQQQAVDQQSKHQREKQIMSSPPFQNAVDFNDARSAPTPAQQPQPKKPVAAGQARVCARLSHCSSLAHADARAKGALSLPSTNAIFQKTQSILLRAKNSLAKMSRAAPRCARASKISIGCSCAAQSLAPIRSQCAGQRCFFEACELHSVRQSTRFSEKRRRFCIKQRCRKQQQQQQQQPFIIY
jgi:hypothetical protein